MKKLLIKAKVIDIPYSPAVEAVPATETEPAIEAIPEQLEVSHIEIIDQTQGSDADLEVWLAGNLFKYPQGSIAEYHDISYEHDLNQCLENRKAEYPSLGDFLNAHFDLNKDFSELELKRLAVKAKYPKPIKGEDVAPVIVEINPIVIEG